jgi:hypothetical protein
MSPLPQPVEEREVNNQNLPNSEAEDVSPNLLALERDIESEQAHQNLVNIYTIMSEYRNYILTIAERKHYWQLAALELDLDLAKFKTMSAHLNLYRSIAERQRQKIVNARTVWQEKLSLARTDVDELAIDKALQQIDLYDKLEIDIERVKNTMLSQIETLQETRSVVKNLQPVIVRQGDAIKYSYQVLARKIYADLHAEGVRTKYIDID